MEYTLATMNDLPAIKALLARYHKDTISQEDIEGNLEVYLRAAKEAEVTPESRLEDVEQNKADKQEVAAVWDSMATAYQEGVQSA